MNKALSKLLRSHYLSLQGYVSAGMEVAKTADVVFMNANENPYDLPGLEGLSRYPEPQPVALLQGYADLYGTNVLSTTITRISSRRETLYRIIIVER